MGGVHGEDTTRSRPVNWTKWFLVIGFVFGLAFLITMPPGATPDERSHLLRVSTISDGWIVPPRVHGSVKNYTIDGCLSGYLWSYATHSEADVAARFRNDNCLPRPDARTAFFNGLRPMENYSPVAYLPALVGYNVGKVLYGPVGSVFLARLVQLLAFLGLVALAIRALPWGKPLMFATALLPTSISAASGVSADAMTIASAFLAIALTLRLVSRVRDPQPDASRGALLAVAVAFVGLGLCKSVYFPLSLMLFTIPTVVFGSLRRKLVWTLGMIGAVALATAAWTLGVVNPLSVANPGSTWVGHQPFRLIALIFHSVTTWSATLPMVGGVIAPLSLNAPGPHAEIGLVVIVVAGLIGVRLLDPLPFRNVSDTDTDTESGVGNDTATDTESVIEPGGRSGVVAIVTPRHQAMTAMLAVVVALGSFTLIEYGLVYTGFANGHRLIFGLQGRYLIPLIPLSLFGINVTRVRAAPRRWFVWVPAASTALLTWWLVTMLRHFNGWF